MGSPYNTDWGNVEIKNAGAVNINVSSETANYTYGISASGKVLIHNGGDGLENKVLKISATDKMVMDARVLTLVVLLVKLRQLSLMVL